MRCEWQRDFSNPLPAVQDSPYLATLAGGEFCAHKKVSAPHNRGAETNLFIRGSILQDYFAHGIALLHDVDAMRGFLRKF